MTPFWWLWQYLLFLCSDYCQTFHFYFNLGKVMDENSIVSSLVPVNMENYSFYQQNPAILIFLTKCDFKNFMLWKWKFPILEKQLFLSITFPFIDDFILTIYEINGSLLMKIKPNWPDSNNQMSKIISKRDRAFWISVLSLRKDVSRRR